MNVLLLTFVFNEFIMYISIVIFELPLALTLLYAHVLIWIGFGWSIIYW